MTSEEKYQQRLDEARRTMKEFLAPFQDSDRVMKEVISWIMEDPDITVLHVRLGVYTAIVARLAEAFPGEGFEDWKYNNNGPTNPKWHEAYTLLREDWKKEYPEGAPFLLLKEGNPQE